MKEFKLDPTSQPHSIVDDAAGNIWYLGNGNGTIGKLVPATGEITVFKMPDPAARDPHTGIFDKDGTLFFTLQQSNMLGRLVPSTGEIKLVTLPTPARGRTGSSRTPGAVWVSYNGAGKIGRMDPVTMAVREYPAARSGVALATAGVTSDDMVWFVNSSLGRLGRLNPKTGEVKEWPSPSGAEVAPLRDRSDRRRHLVQRIGPAAGRAGAVRSEDRAIPELGDSVGRRHHPAHAEDPGRQPGDPPDQHQPDRAGDHRQAGDGHRQR